MVEEEATGVGGRAELLSGGNGGRVRTGRVGGLDERKRERETR